MTVSTRGVRQQYVDISDDEEEELEEQEEEEEEEEKEEEGVEEEEEESQLNRPEARHIVAPAIKGLRVDILDHEGIWNTGVIVNKKSSKVEVEYDGWGSSYNEWIDLDAGRLAPLHMYTMVKKCWAKLKKWPWWPAFAVLRAPTSRKAAESLSLETKIYVEFFDGYDKTKRSRCWMQKHQVSSFRDAFEQKSSKNVGKSFDLYVDGAVHSLASEVPIRFTGKGTLPVEYANKFGIPLDKRMKSLSAEQREKAFIMFSDRYDQLYGYDTLKDIGSVKNEPKVKAQTQRKEAKQEIDSDKFEEVKKVKIEEEIVQRKPKRRSKRAAPATSSSSTKKRTRRTASSRSASSEEEQKNEDQYDNDKADGSLFGTENNSEEEEENPDDEPEIVHVTKKPDQIVQKGKAPLSDPAKMEKVHKRKKVIEELLESSLRALEESKAHKKLEEENSSTKAKSDSKASPEKAGTQNAPVVIESSPEDTEDAFEFTEDPDKPDESNDATPQSEATTSAGAGDFEEPAETDDLPNVSDIFYVPTENIAPEVYDTSAELVVPDERADTSIEPVSDEQALVYESADALSESVSEKQVGLVGPSEPDVASEPVLDEPTEPAVYQEADTLTTSLPTVPTVSRDVSGIKMKHLNECPEDKILPTENYEDFIEASNDNNIDEADEEDEEDEEEANSRTYWSNTCNFTSIQAWLMDGVVAKVKDNEAQMVASSNG